MIIAAFTYSTAGRYRASIPAEGGSARAGHGAQRASVAEQTIVDTLTSRARRAKTTWQRSAAPPTRWWTGSPTTSPRCPRGRSGSRSPTRCASELLELPLPEQPTALDELVATVLRDVLPHAMGNGHPAFFGWVNPPPSPAGVLASLAAAAMNPSVVSGDHADVHLERAVVRWLAELVGFPHAPGAGLLTSGASAATIVCLAGARGRALAAAGHDVRRDGLAGAPRLIAYVPAEAHSCVRRALELLGLGSGAMRAVPLAGGRLDATALRAAIAADRAGGALPALLVGSAGTVNTGAIDPLDALADVAAAEGLWFHVDGAYGAFGVLDPAIAARYRGMERADSLALDPHKWLGVPVDAGCALVRRGDDLRDAFSLIPPYLRQDAGAAVGHVRRVRARADAAVPRAQDVGDDRRARTRRHRRPGRARERARPRAGDAGRARARAGARRRARDLDRRLPRAPGGLPARPGWTSSTAPCPRRSRRAGAPSSPARSSTAARRCAPASCTRTRARSTSRPSSPRSSRPPAHWSPPPPTETRCGNPGAPLLAKPGGRGGAWTARLRSAPCVGGFGQCERRRVLWAHRLALRPGGAEGRFAEFVA